MQNVINIRILLIYYIASMAYNFFDEKTSGGAVKMKIFLIKNQLKSHTNENYTQVL